MLFRSSLRLPSSEWKTSGYNQGYLSAYSLGIGKNLVIYQCGSECYNQLYALYESSNARSQNNTERYSQGIIQAGNDRVIEFRQYFDDYTSRRYSVLLYNKSELNLFVNKAKADAAQKSDARLGDGTVPTPGVNQVKFTPPKIVKDEEVKPREIGRAHV